MGSTPVSWRHHTSGIAVDNRGPPIDGLLFPHSWGKHNNRPGLLQTRLPGRVLRHLGHALRRLGRAPFLDLFPVPDLWVLFRLLLAFYFAPFNFLVFVSYLKTLG